LGKKKKEKERRDAGNEIEACQAKRHLVLGKDFRWKMSDQEGVFRHEGEKALSRYDDKGERGNVKNNRSKTTLFCGNEILRGNPHSGGNHGGGNRREGRGGEPVEASTQTPLLNVYAAKG